MSAQPTAVVPLRAPDVASPITTPDELAAAFLAGYGEQTAEAYARDLRRWGDYLSAIGVDVLGAHRVHVDAFVREQVAEGAAPATIARRLAALSGFYAYALDEGMVARSPVVRVRRPKVADESPRLGLDREQMRALLDAAEADSERSAALVALLGLNGLRISEALASEVTDLGHDRGHRTLRIVRKGGKVAVAPLAPRTAAVVDALIGDRTSGPIFQTRSGRPMDRQSAWKIVRRLARAAGVEGAVCPHAFRHGFVTAALDAGVSLRDVQDAAGHADPRTTRRYDRARHSLDRHATYSVAAHMA
jgi:site-specific recombinase XerD